MGPHSASMFRILVGCFASKSALCNATTFCFFENCAYKLRKIAVVYCLLMTEGALTKKSHKKSAEVRSIGAFVTPYASKVGSPTNVSGELTIRAAVDFPLPGWRSMKLGAHNSMATGGMCSLAGE